MIPFLGHREFVSERQASCLQPIFVSRNHADALLKIWENGHTGTGKCIFARSCRQSLKAVPVVSFLHSICLFPYK